MFVVDLKAVDEVYTILASVFIFRQIGEPGEERFVQSSYMAKKLFLFTFLLQHICHSSSPCSHHTSLRYNLWGGTRKLANLNVK